MTGQELRNGQRGASERLRAPRGSESSKSRQPGQGYPRQDRRRSRLILFNKPYDVLCKFTDSLGRPTLADYLSVPGVYPAGRLDKDSEGLLLLTDDGRLAHQIAHPRFKLPKTYLVQVEGAPDKVALAALERGVEIPDKREGAGVRLRTGRADVERLDGEPELWPRPKPVRIHGATQTAWLRIEISEGRKRQVRHMTAAVGYPTLRLVRVAVGPLQLGDLQPGQWRDATAHEWALLRNLRFTRRSWG